MSDVKNSKVNEKSAENPPAGDASVTENEKTLFSWKAPARPFKRRPKEFWLRVIVIVSVFGFILYLIEGAMPVILLIAVVFLFYILTNVEPEEIEFKITNYGVYIADQANDWSYFNRFWFSKKFNIDILVLEAFNLAGRLELVINPKDKESIQKALLPYLIHEEAPPTTVDKTTNWISEKLLGN